MRTLAGLLLLLTLPASGLAQEPPEYSGAYFCKATASGGLAYDKTLKKWVGAVFNIADESYVVTAKATGRTEPDPTFQLPTRTYNIKVKEFGTEGEGRECFAARRAGTGVKDIRIDDFGHGTCIYLGYDYEFNFKSLRLQVTFRGGFMDSWRENTDTPFITAAQCEKIS